MDSIGLSRQIKITSILDGFLPMTNWQFGRAVFCDGRSVTILSTSRLKMVT